MKYALYGMNVRGEYAVIEEFDSEAKAIHRMDMHKECGRTVLFNHKVLWFWVDEVIPGAYYPPYDLRLLSESLSDANKYR